MLTLNNLKSPKGSTRNKKRLGRGVASGQGKQAGKGHKGQKARSGGGVRPGFEGGTLPLYMRLPKRGFTNALFKKEFAVINLEIIEKKFDREKVDRNTLVEKGLLKGKDQKRPIKILGKGKLSKALEFEGISKFSRSAAQAIENAGGQIKQVPGAKKAEAVKG